MFGRKKTEMPDEVTALTGKDTAMEVPPAHYVNGNLLAPPFPDGLETAVFGMGCFWGAERLFWQLPGVYTTAVVTPGASRRTPTTARCAAA